MLFWEKNEMLNGKALIKKRKLLLLQVIFNNSPSENFE